MMTFRLQAMFCAAALTLSPLLPGNALAASPDAKGFWLTENNKAIVEFSECEGQKMCGHIVCTANPRDETGKLKLDVENPNPDRRDQPVCGIKLIGNMTPVSQTEYKDGWVYNPRSGETYSAKVEMISPDRLKMRGFLGISLLGKSQTWTRVEDARTGCN